MKAVKIILLAVVMVMAACSKRDYVNDVVNVTIGYRIIDSFPMTKAVSDADISNYLLEVMPTNLEFTLTDSKGNVYKVTQGEETALKCGTYTIKASTKPDNNAAILGSSAWFSTTPWIRVNTSIVIEPDKNTYVVDAEYNCFAIVVDLSEVSEATYLCSHSESGTIPFQRKTNYAICFVVGSYGGYTLSITIVPISADRENTTVVFSETYGTDVVVSQKGYYYILHPNIKNASGLNVSYTWGNLTRVEIGGE